MLVEGKITDEIFVDFLKRLIHYWPNPVFLFVDGHPIHRSKVVARFVASTDDKLRLFILPLYSPELNPDEQVWNHLKNHWSWQATHNRSRPSEKTDYLPSQKDTEIAYPYMLLLWHNGNHLYRKLA
jgi:transposase